jgi:hypothetical protein
MCFTSKDIADALIVKIEYCPLLPRRLFLFRWCKNGNLSNFNSCEPNNIYHLFGATIAYIAALIFGHIGSILVWITGLF